MGDC